MVSTCRHQGCKGKFDKAFRLKGSTPLSGNPGLESVAKVIRSLMFHVERPRRINYITTLGIQAPRTTELLCPCYKGQMPSDINERIKNMAWDMTLSTDQEAGGQGGIINLNPFSHCW